MAGGQQSNVPWEPLLTNQPGQKTSLGIPSVPFKMPLRDGAAATVSYRPNIAMQGLVHGISEYQLNVRLKKLPDGAPECSRAKDVPDPDKAMHAMLGLMGPSARSAFGQLLQRAPGEVPQNVPHHPQPSPGYQSDYGQQSPGYPPPGYQSGYGLAPS